MKAVKNLFILIGLFLLSQVGMTVFSVVKIYYLEAGEPRIPAMMSYGLIALLLANIGLMMYLARKLELATFDFGWSTKRNWLWIIGGFVLGRVIAVGGTMYLQHISDQEATANDAVLGGTVYRRKSAFDLSIDCRGGANHGRDRFPWWIHRPFIQEIPDSRDHLKCGGF